MGNPMQVLYAKLRALKKELRSFNKNALEEISLKVKELRASLESVQTMLMNGNANEEVLNSKLSLHQQLREACLQGEVFLR